MADKTFVLSNPPVKAVDLLDGTHAMSISECGVAPGTGTDTTFVGTIPPLKAVDLGAGTYAVHVEVH